MAKLSAVRNPILDVEKDHLSEAVQNCGTASDLLAVSSGHG